MPLFCFFSGFFTRVGVRDKKTFCGVFHILSLFLIFHFIICIIWDKPINYRNILSPQYGTWYLLCLFYWRLFSAFLTDKHVTWYNVIIALFISLISGFIPFVGNILSFQLAVDMFFYFFLGLVIRKYRILDYLDAIPVKLSMVSLILFFIMLYILWPDKLGLRLNLYHNYGNNSMVLFGERFMIIISSILTSVFFLRLTKKVVCDSLSRLGANTLFIYLYHIFFIYIVHVLVRADKLTFGVLEVFLCSATILIVLVILLRVRFLTEFVKFNLFEKFLLT